MYSTLYHLTEHLECHCSAQRYSINMIIRTNFEYFHTQNKPIRCRETTVFSETGELKYSTVSFCDGLFYDDSLLRPLSSRTEHSRLVVHHCRNSEVLSVLSAPLALFWCACVSYFFYFSAVILSLLWFFLPRRPSKRQKRRKNQNS